MDLMVQDSMEGPDLLSGDPTRKFIRHMFGAIAEYEKDMIVFNYVRLGNANEPGTANAKAENPILRPRPRLFAKSSVFADGAKEKQMPFPMVALELNRKGLRTCSGTLFTSMNVAAMLRRNE